METNYESRSCYFKTDSYSTLEHTATGQNSNLLTFYF